MIIETHEMIVAYDGGRKDYFPDDVLEVKYNAVKDAMRPRTITGRFDSIRHNMAGEKFLHLDISSKYRKDIESIPLNEIKEIKRVEVGEL